MLNWAEIRAGQVTGQPPENLRISYRIGSYSLAEDAHQMFRESGFTYIRSSYRLQIDLQAQPPEPVWPEGLSIRSYNPDTNAEAVYRTEVEAFRDHFGYIEEPFEAGFERFMHFNTGYTDFDPGIWYLAMDGDEIAGMCLCRPCAIDDPEMGYVNILGVCCPWRKRGLGLAFLQHAFGEFYRRGYHKAGLGVDSQNLTRALRFYKKAGMHVHQQFDMYEKEIRPGKEISVQSLED
ncbi:MAG: GNAT family N-acetyltransferase [Anaerolineales bacterium]|nr:GNAT family N-acetyltransferase [Anaerolineales bacterium]